MVSAGQCQARIISISIQGDVGRDWRPVDSDTLQCLEHRSAGNAHDVAGTLVRRAVVWQRVQDNLELVHVAEFTWEPPLVHKLWDEAEEGLHAELEFRHGDALHPRRRIVGLVEQARRDGGYEACSGLVGPSGHNVLAYVAADGALDALHVAVAAHVADGVTTALRDGHGGAVRAPEHELGGRHSRARWRG